MDSIKIFWGADQKFEAETENLREFTYLIDVLNHINKTDLNIQGIDNKNDPPMVVENLLVHTDDYGGIREWALLGFSNNVLENLKVQIKNLWLSNPPDKIYKDIIKNYADSIIKEYKPEYAEMTISDLKKMADGFNEAVIGQPYVMQQVLPSLYSLKNSARKRPVTLLFLGDSGIGKTETAKYISTSLGMEMVRIQFSMQQTSSAYQYIFGGEHGEDSLARELVRRNSNIILLDEFDKVPPAFYNAFYQMFDEGEFVDANYSVDVSKCIIMCTTNYRTEEDAEKYLGTPIYSRFSKVVRFEPISTEDKLKIMRKTYEDLLDKMDKQDRELIIDNTVLDSFVKVILNGAYPNMRMLRNDIEDALNYEILKARGIIN